MKIYRWLAVVAMALTISACSSKKEKNVKIDPPVAAKASIYEVYVRNFTPEGTFKAMIPRLAELKQLGVNTLWLMPIHPVGIENRKGTFGSPYAIKDYMEVNPEFGTKADFKELVDSCHANGLHIIIDFVANHTAWDHPWTKQHPDWYTKDSLGNFQPPVADWTDVADLNYENDSLKEAMTQVLEYWVKEFDIDGYRCDVAEMVPIEWWKTSIDRVKKIKPVLMLAEGADPELYAAGFDLTYSWDLYHNLKQVFKGDSATLIPRILAEETGRLPKDALRMRFITNHDETSWDDVPVILFKSKEGSKAAFFFSAAMPGIPLLYNGQEVAHPTKMNLFEKSDILWTANTDVRDFYKKTLDLKNNEPDLRTVEVKFDSSSTKDVLLFHRGQAGAGLYGIVNFRDTVSTFKIPVAMQGKRFMNLYTGKSVLLEAELMLLNFEFYLLKEEKAL